MFDDLEPDILFSNEKIPRLYQEPVKTTEYVQLRFQLARFQVYRVVHLPLTFTFANLHMLIQYMFGWSDSHLHHAEVFPNTVLHNEVVLLGTIKSCGRRRALEDYELGDPRLIEDWRRFAPSDRPIYRVQPRVKHRKDKIDKVMTMEEKGVTLGSIWTHDDAHNVSDGECPNEQVSVIYTYNYCEEWNVHITCDRENLFHRLVAPKSLPIFIDAKGAPPIEHPRRDPDFSLEDEAEDKTISPRLFDVSYFQRYCNGEIISETRRSQLEILTLEEVNAQREEYLKRKREKEERAATAELNEDEELDDSDDEYEDCYD